MGPRVYFPANDQHLPNEGCDFRRPQGNAPHKDEDQHPQWLLLEQRQVHTGALQRQLRHLLPARCQGTWWEEEVGSVSLATRSLAFAENLHRRINRVLWCFISVV